MKTKFGFGMALRLLVILAVALLCCPVLAQSGSGGGGGGGGTDTGTSGSGGSGGSGGGGGGSQTVTTTTINMSNGNTLFNGVLPQGTATFTYTSTTALSVNIQFNHLNLPDDTDVEVLFNTSQMISGWVQTEMYIYHTTVVHQQGSLSISGSTGQLVPFLPAKVGQTNFAVRYLQPGTVPLYVYPLTGTLF